MKKLIFIMIFFVLFSSVYAEFDPGDILSAAKRSLGLMGLFKERWYVMKNSKSVYELIKADIKKSKINNDSNEVLEEDNNGNKKDIREFYYYLNRGSYSKYVDLFVKYDFIPNFNLRTVFGNQEFDMNYLVLSSIVKFDDLVKTELFSWGFGIGLSGARYGLTKDVVLDGPGFEKFETIDMVYNQVYDDLLVFSNIFKPFGDLHIGILFNRDLDVGIDNVPGTSDDTEKKFKTLFIDTNVLNIGFSLGYSYDKKEYNYFDLNIAVTDMLYDFTDWIKNRYLWPDFSISYIYSKNDFESSANHLLYFDFFYSTYSYFYFKFKYGAPLYGQEGLEKEVGIKEVLGEIGFHPQFAKIARNPKNYYKDEYSSAFFYYILVGVSFFNDNRLINFGNEDSTVFGFMVGLKMSFALWIGGFDIWVKFSRNYSEKLNKMIESYDRNYIEFAAQLGF